MDSLLFGNGTEVEEDAYYSYKEHVNPDESDENCMPTNIESEGLALLKGMHIPHLSGCTHDVKWKLSKKL